LGLSQARVAELAGMTQAGVSLVESGRALPRDDTKVVLARALGTTPADLFPWPPMEDLA
jgi:transcriptional regulator with XRE-family HTH domain